MALNPRLFATAWILVTSLVACKSGISIDVNAGGDNQSNGSEDGRAGASDQQSNDIANIDPNAAPGVGVTPEASPSPFTELSPSPTPEPTPSSTPIDACLSPNHVNGDATLSIIVVPSYNRTPTFTWSAGSRLAGCATATTLAVSTNADCSSPLLQQTVSTSPVTSITIPNASATTYYACLAFVRDQSLLLKKTQSFTVATAPDIYWGDNGRFAFYQTKANGNGPAESTLLSSRSYGLERVGTSLYVGGATIQKFDTTNNQSTELLSLSEVGFATELAVTANHLYWVDYNSSRVLRADLPTGGATKATNISVIYSKPADIDGWMAGLAVDAVAGKMWVSIVGFVVNTPSRHMPGSRLLEINLSDNSITTIRRGWVPSDPNTYSHANHVMIPISVTYDTSYIYISDIESRLVRRYLRSNTATMEQFASSVTAIIPRDLQIEDRGGSGTFLLMSSSSTGIIEKCLSSFTHATNCVTQINPTNTTSQTARGFAFDADNYYVLNGASTLWKIPRATPNDLGVQLTATTPNAFSFVRGSAVDRTKGFMWAGTEQGIYRKNLATGVVDHVVIAASQVHDIELDTQNEKIYWADYNANKIFRANYDGSNKETLVTGLGTWIAGIALHLGQNKIYWTDNNTSNNVLRANLDGSGIERLLTWSTATTGSNKMGMIRDIDYIPSLDKFMVMGGSDGGWIGVVSLDGSIYEPIVQTSYEGFAGIAYEPWTETVYYPTTSGIRRIKRDGSGDTEIVATGPSASNRYVSGDFR